MKFFELNHTIVVKKALLTNDKSEWNFYFSNKSTKYTVFTTEEML